MKKFLTVLLILFLQLYISLSAAAADDDEAVRKIRAGVFFKVTPLEEINTLIADKNDAVKFINLSDMYLYETNAAPRNTIFYGIIEDIKEPVQGRDAAVKILINKMAAPDNKVYNIKGHLYSSNNNYIGGGKTQNAYYHKVYHHTKGWRPFLQEAPLNIQEQGRHTIIRPGSEFFVILEEDIIIK